jgi:hypothetical protein
VQALERELERAAASPGDSSSTPRRPEQRPEPGTGAEPAEQLARRHEVAGLDGGALLEAALQPGQVGAGEQCAEGVGGGPPQQVVEHLELPALLGRLELDLAARGVDHRRQVADARDGRPSPVIAARRTAEAATVSAAATAKRALTPERWSTCGDSRTSRV